jgi:hypothetical protein
VRRNARSPERPKVDPADLAAAAEAALGKPKAKAAPKATVAEVTAMAQEKFGKGRAKAKAKASVKKQLKDTIVRVPVAKARGRKGRNTRSMEAAAVAVA